MLLLHDLEPIHWALAGTAIAAITLLLQYFGNRSLGLSSGLEDLCALGSRAPYFRRPEVGRGSWRLPFLGGLLLGGVLSAVLGGGWAPTWDAGLLDSRAGLGTGAKVAWFFAGGVLIGFGTRLAGGCTSGHGIFGMARLQPGSLVSTCAFMAAGALTTNLLFRLIWP